MYKLELDNEKNQKFITNNDHSNCSEKFELITKLVAKNLKTIQEVNTLVFSLRFFHYKYDKQKLDTSDAEFIEYIDMEVLDQLRQIFDK